MMTTYVKNILNKYGCNNVITSLSAKAYKSKKFIIGDTFNKQWMGEYPDLKNLDNRGDLIPNISPSNLYDYIQKKIWG